MSEAVARTKRQGAGRERARVLVVDDDPVLLRTYRRILEAAEYEVHLATDAEQALQMLEVAPDVIVSDIAMPSMSGIDLLRVLRERGTATPVVLVTAQPHVDTAAAAVEFGAFRYLTKPDGLHSLTHVLAKAVRIGRMAHIRQELLYHSIASELKLTDDARLETSFARAMDSLWMAYQPIVSWSGKRVHAHEALLRCKEPTIPHPGAFLDAARLLGRHFDLGRRVRATVAGRMAEEGRPAIGFVNLASQDLLDEELFDPGAPLAKVASRVVLEVTERSPLDEIGDLRARIAKLRGIGYRIALDDLGAGYSGLGNFTQLEPDVVKLDMGLVRGVDVDATKRRLVRSMIQLCRDMEIAVVGEGVETVAERDVLADLGCDLFQGYLFARPGPEPSGVSFPTPVE
jgi:EAL domain-containing protein (putative c-di-GMP-specific phosphodiesterase class I)/CheY-like chemotaxis protein